ncbi:hypothetical protein [Mycobacterium sp. E1747]|uniref:hypothetical protein n=1 Tax=Mycobacterium sp. E1747 TaxID=1834128 RepID=UPI0009EE18DE|nr:hypothetical protein [Mycobacterium sp. E1747]
MGASDVDPDERARELRKNLAAERLTYQVEKHHQQSSDLRALARRSESRIVALSEHLSRSQAELESTSARFNELAGAIPSDVAGLSAQLSRILNAATAEANDIRAEAQQFANAARVEAEERASKILTEAQLELDSATTLRVDLEAQGSEVRADIARLREQAHQEAAEIISEAKDTAEQMLARAQRDIDRQLAVAEAKLDELRQVRAHIATQLTHFYDKFNQLEGSFVGTDRVPPVHLASDSLQLPPSYGAHAATEIHRSIG